MECKREICLSGWSSEAWPAPISSPSEIWDSSVRFGEWHCTQATDLVKHNQATLHKIVEALLTRQQNVVCSVSCCRSLGTARFHGKIRGNPVCVTHLSPLKMKGLRLGAGSPGGRECTCLESLSSRAWTFLDRHCFPRVRTQIAACTAVAGAGFGAVSGVVAGVERG